MGHAQAVVGFEDLRRVFTSGVYGLGRIGGNRCCVFGRVLGGRSGSGWGGRGLCVSEGGGWRQHQAEQQGGHRAPGARSIGWRSGEMIACHAGRT
ncbi:hypothetical protein D3C84_988240 [compost metagenome]